MQNTGQRALAFERMSEAVSYFQAARTLRFRAGNKAESESVRQLMQVAAQWLDKQADEMFVMGMGDWEDSML